jgi:hypothetical protein
LSKRALELDIKLIYTSQENKVVRLALAIVVKMIMEPVEDACGRLRLPNPRGRGQVRYVRKEKNILCGEIHSKLDTFQYRIRVLSTRVLAS